MWLPFPQIINISNISEYVQCMYIIQMFFANLKIFNIFHSKYSIKTKTITMKIQLWIEGHAIIYSWNSFVATVILPSGLAIKTPSFCRWSQMILSAHSFLCQIHYQMVNYTWNLENLDNFLCEFLSVDSIFTSS